MKYIESLGIPRTDPRWVMGNILHSGETCICNTYFIPNFVFLLNNFLNVPHNQILYHRYFLSIQFRATYQIPGIILEFVALQKYCLSL